MKDLKNKDIDFDKMLNTLLSLTTDKQREEIKEELNNLNAFDIPYSEKFVDIGEYTTSEYTFDDYIGLDEKGNIIPK